MSKTSILDYFPNHLQPRSVQRETLLQLEANWKSSDIFVVNLPVASGKSAVAMSVARWTKGASIITPTKILVNQYKKEYRSVHVLRAKKDYFCDFFQCPLDKRPVRGKEPKTCPPLVKCAGCTQYKSDLRKARVVPTLLGNYFIYLSHKLHRPTLVVDEAHNLIPTLQGLAAKKLWQHDFNFSSNMKTRDDIIKWVETLSEDAFKYTKVEKRFKKLKAELFTTRPKFLLRVEDDMFNGEMRLCLKMIPLDIRDEPPFMWPEKVKKIILMSATISRKDIEQLGLSDKKVCFIEADSPIAAKNRPVLIPKTASNMSFKSQDENLPKLVQFIQNKANEYDAVKGLVHCTYSLAKKLKAELEHDSRFLFHDQENKQQVYDRFRDSKQPKVLIASGMYEGVDLPYDAGRWQVIAKVPYPSLGEPAIKFKSKIDPSFYSWETIKVVLQACGRICRTPTDYGETFIFDSAFERLHNQNLDLIPLWFQDSIQEEN